MKKIFLKGACDIDALCFYLKPKHNILIQKEGGIQTEKHGIFYGTSHTEILMHLNEKFSDKFIDNDFYKSAIFDSDNDLIILSIISEYQYGLYRNKITGMKVLYGERTSNCFKFPEQYSDITLDFGFPELTDDDYNSISENYEFVGWNDVETITKNFKIFLSRFNQNTKFVFLLGPVIHDEEFEKSRPIRGCETFFASLNQELKEQFASNKNVYFVDPNLYLKKHYKSEYYYYNYQSIVHYKRYVYYQMAKELECLFPSLVKATYKRERIRKIKKHIKKIFRK